MIIDISTKIGTTSNQKGFKGLLDVYSGAAAAYSLRKLSKATTSVVSVRRNSDNAEADFTALEITDGTLEAWVGAGNDGLVTTWYDQSGNGNDATQASASSQPKIVSAGVLVTENGKAAVDFDGVDDGLVKTGFSITGTSAVNSFTVGYGVSSSASGMFTINGSIGGADAFTQTTEVGVRTGGGFATFGTQSPSVISLVNMLSPANANISDVICFINGGSSARTGLGDNAIDFGATTDLGIGESFISNFDGIVSEVILYDSDQSSNRSGIEANINKHYNIYP